jgi:Protein of unknown function (DUF1269)
MPMASNCSLSRVTPRQFAAGCDAALGPSPHQTRAVGAAIGGLSSHLGGYGIDDGFIKQVRTKVTEGTSNLLLAGRSGDSQQSRGGLRGGAAFRAHREQPDA